MRGPIYTTTTEKLLVGQRIKAMRTRRKMTRLQLLMRVKGRGPNTVYQWETGQRMPCLIMAARVAKVFGISVDELIKGVDL